MEYAKLKTLTLSTFDKNKREDLEFVKKLCKDESIGKWFHGITVGLLHNPKNEFLDHSFLVRHNDTLVGYIGIGNFNEMEKSVYLRAAIDKDQRGKKYGEILLQEITDYIFENYSQVESIRLKIDRQNKASLSTANACGYKWLENEIFAKFNPYINNKKL